MEKLILSSATILTQWEKIEEGKKNRILSIKLNPEHIEKIDSAALENFYQIILKAQKEGNSENVRSNAVQFAANFVERFTAEQLEEIIKNYLQDDSFHKFIASGNLKETEKFIIRFIKKLSGDQAFGIIQLLQQRGSNFEDSLLKGDCYLMALKAAGEKIEELTGEQIATVILNVFPKDGKTDVDHTICMTQDRIISLAEQAKYKLQEEKIEEICKKFEDLKQGNEATKRRFAILSAYSKQAPEDRAVEDFFEAVAPLRKISLSEPSPPVRAATSGRHYTP